MTRAVFFAALLLAPALDALAKSPEDLPSFSAADLEPAQLAQIREFAAGDPDTRSRLFSHLQNVFPHAFKPNEWRVDWSKLHYRVSPSDVIGLFGEPDARFSLGDEPRQIVGVPSKGADLSEHRVMLYKGHCAEHHFKAVVKGKEKTSDGTFCDVLRFEFDSGILVDQIAMELAPTDLPSGMKD